MILVFDFTLKFHWTIICDYYFDETTHLVYMILNLSCVLYYLFSRIVVFYLFFIVLIKVFMFLRIIYVLFLFHFTLC